MGEHLQKKWLQIRLTKIQIVKVVCKITYEMTTAFVVLVRRES